MKQVYICADFGSDGAENINEVPRIAQQFGLDSSVKVNMTSVIHATTTAVNLTRSVARAAS